MAKRSTKHQSVTPISMVLNGGLNYSSTPSNIADNELTRANNVIYDPATDMLVTRPGTVYQTDTSCDGTYPIIALYYYEQSATQSYLIGACNGNLYYYASNSWTKIGSLTDATTVPSFLTFNTKLLIADGGSAIRTWNGTDYTTIANSPKASILKTIRNRVVCNDISEMDSVYFSKAEDESDWETSGESAEAVGLRCGYGDNLTVNAFAVFGDDLIVSKKGDKTKKLYRINVADTTPANWYVKELSSNNCSQNNKSITEAWNNVFFVDENGFKTLRGVQEYGDLQVSAIGRKINNIFMSQTTCDFMTYIPKYNAIWFGMGDRVFCYTERFNTGADITPAFTQLLFQQGRIMHVIQAGESVYLAGYNGYLYKLDETYSTDNINSTDTQNFTSVIRTKNIPLGVDGILRKIQVYFKARSSGVAIINVILDDETTTRLKTVTLHSSGTYLHDATEYLYDATEYLYEEGHGAWIETSRNRVRSNCIAFEVMANSGRMGIEIIKAEIALVEGG